MNPQEAYLHNVQLLQSVVAEMKEIPVLPSEEPTDVQPLTKVELPDDGGVLTWMGGQDYPYKGFPFFETVDKIDIFKKVTRNILSGLYHALKGRNKLWFITLIPALWLIKVIVRAGIYTFYRLMERVRIKRLRYCDSVRELYDAFSTDRVGESLKTKELRLQMRDFICMTLEFDNAYRFRFQDLVTELDKNNLIKDTSGEIIHLFEIMQTREKEQSVRDTWTLFKLLTRFYFRVDKDLRDIVRDTLLALDISKASLSVEDMSYCIPRKDYNFGFMLDSKNQELIKRVQLSRKKIDLRTSVRNQSTTEHQAMFARQKQELIIDPEVDKKIQEESSTLSNQVNLEADVKFRDGLIVIKSKSLTPEQLAMIEAHQLENKLLDERFNKLLESIDSYKE